MGVTLFRFTAAPRAARRTIPPDRRQPFEAARRASYDAVTLQGESDMAKDMKQRGFTLIEILIVVAVLAILAVVAYPSYQDYIVRSQLAEARGALADMRVRMEQYFLDNRTYAGADTAAAPNPCTPPAGLSNRFTYSCNPAPDATTYTIQAVGNASTAVNGFTFTINQANQRASAVPTAWGGNQACWIVRKGQC
jgi:type IV pilus assembly protein PilE